MLKIVLWSMSQERPLVYIHMMWHLSHKNINISHFKQNYTYVPIFGISSEYKYYQECITCVQNRCIKTLLLTDFSHFVTFLLVLYQLCTQGEVIHKNIIISWYLTNLTNICNSHRRIIFIIHVSTLRFSFLFIHYFFLKSNNIESIFIFRRVWRCLYTQDVTLVPHKHHNFTRQTKLWICACFWNLTKMSSRIYNMCSKSFCKDVFLLHHWLPSFVTLPSALCHECTRGEATHSQDEATRGGRSPHHDVWRI